MSLRLNSCNHDFQLQTLHSVTKTNTESKDTSLQYFFISVLFKTKDP